MRVLLPFYDKYIASELIFTDRLICHNHFRLSGPPLIMIFAALFSSPSYMPGKKLDITAKHLSECPAHDKTLRNVLPRDQFQNS